MTDGSCEYVWRNIMTIILGILEEGLVYAIMALGVYITYKILDFPDLSVDGTFPLGAAVTAGRHRRRLSLTGRRSGCRLFNRRTGRLYHRSDPCEIKGSRPFIRHHCHDSPLFHQSADRREGKPSYI